MLFLHRNSPLFQFGFHCGLLTELAATLLLNDVRRKVDLGKLVGTVFIDLRKDFDTSHAKLLEKLSRYGINDDELEWFKDYLFSRKATVAYLIYMISILLSRRVNIGSVSILNEISFDKRTQGNLRNF
jgi:hypothetical protein